jgi:ribose 5-phosphate isomerase B
MQIPSLTTIHLATDHAGYIYKELIKTFLEEKGYKVIDHGAYEFDPADDYPNFVSVAAEFVSKANNDDELGIVLGATGQGESITAMQYSHIRTTVCYGGPMAEEIVVAGKAHNNANVLSLGAKHIEQKDVLRLVELWLNTPFTREERHLRRLTQIAQLKK